MKGDIRAIELKRLHELEKQAALGGPNTEPAILIEIQELRTKHPHEPRNGGTGRSILQNEFDFLANTVGASLVRLTAVEGRQAVAEEHRAELAKKIDLLIYAIHEIGHWMRAGAALAIVTLILVIIIAIVVF